MLLLDLPGKLYKHRYNCFLVGLLFGPASSRFSQHLTVFKFKNLLSRAKQQKQEIQEHIGAYRFCHERSGVILIG